MKYILSKVPYALPFSKRVLSLLMVIAFFGLAVSVIHHEMKAYPLDAILLSFYAISPVTIALALMATIISYIGIAFYDGLALRYTNKTLNWSQTAFTSCCAHAISTTLGAAALTSNAVRYRLYSSWGINLKDVAIVGVVALIVSVCGAFSMMALGFLLETHTFERVFKIPSVMSYVQEHQF